MSTAFRICLASSLGLAATFASESILLGMLVGAVMWYVFNRK